MIYFTTPAILDLHSLLEEVHVHSSSKKDHSSLIIHLILNVSSDSDSSCKGTEDGSSRRHARCFLYRVLSLSLSCGSGGSSTLTQWNYVAGCLLRTFERMMFSIVHRSTVFLGLASLFNSQFRDLRKDGRSTSNTS